MQAVIMAGGMGIRLRPLTDRIPKPMVKIIDKPVLEYTVQHLKNCGVTDISMTLCYRPSVIIRHFGDGSKLGVKIKYFVEKTPMGTAGGVAAAAKGSDGPFLVVSGDAFTDIDYSELVNFHENHGGAVTVAVKEVKNPSSFGVVETDNNGKITRFEEKPSAPSSFTVNTGVYVMDKTALDLVPENVRYDFAKDLFPMLIGNMYAMKTDCYWSDIGTLSSYYLTNNDVALDGKRFGFCI